MENKTPLVIVTGPTASGKTALSVSLAKRINGEIISADSMQVYRGMDIGTAKATPLETEGIAHHMIDILEPGEDFNVCIFTDLSKKAIGDITGRGKISVVAGGTGFYIHALLYDCGFEEEVSEEHEKVRRRYEGILRNEGPDKLYSLLENTDPASAAAIHKNNTKRVIRALEYYELTGKRISEHNEENRRKESPYNFACFVLDMPRDVLYQRIDRRVDIMRESGLTDEVRALAKRGLSVSDNSMQAIGYRQLLMYLNGELTEDEAYEKIKLETRHFAKRQLTWFRREPDAIFISEDEYRGNDAKLEFILKTLERKKIL